MSVGRVSPDDAVRARRFVAARTADGTIHAFGRVVAYSDRPTFLIELADGTRISWIADLCRHAEADEVTTALQQAWDRGEHQPP